MRTTKFSACKFNPKAFAYSVKKTKGLKADELIKAKALVSNPDIRCAFSGAGSSGYSRIIMRGALDGDAYNYDGATDISTARAKVFEQGVVVVGRAKGWVEKDFVYDLGGGDFMDSVARQVAQYKDDLDLGILRAILDGVFSMKGTQNEKFVTAHTYDISGGPDGGVITPVALNNAAYRACGANKKAFTVVLMHSTIATTLENLNLLQFMKYTDKEGITREIQLGTWSGRLVIICDDLPVDGDKYTTYIFGEGAFAYEDLPVKNAYELARDPKTNGGEDALFMRQRKVFAPYGISYEKQIQSSVSPTDDELSEGENWTLANIDCDTYIDHAKIPIARIISNG